MTCWESDDDEDTKSSETSSATDDENDDDDDDEKWAMDTSSARAYEPRIHRRLRTVDAVTLNGSFENRRQEEEEALIA